MTVEHVSSDSKRGITFGELIEFVQDAMHNDVDKDEVIRIEATWRSSIKTMKVRGPIPKEYDEEPEG